MNNPNPELVILPFQARLGDDPAFLTFEQVLLLRLLYAPLRIERSYPGWPHAIGWTIFRRLPGKYRHAGAPFFLSEHRARRYLRRVYAIQHSLDDGDALTHSHLHLL